MIIGCDVGGTFTDTVFVSKGEIKISKVPTTPDNFAEGVLQGIARVSEEYQRVVHGMTVGTNAVLQRKGARVTLITNKGFKDILEIGRQNRPSLYDFSVERPPPLVPRDRRIEVSGRINFRGEIIEELLEENIELPEKTESVAVCLLHSYANPVHEQKIKSMVNIPVCISSDILPEFREYERMSTTVINAYLMPVIDKYLSNLEKRISSPLMVIESSGGIMSALSAREKPVHTVLSGPAGGVIASHFLGELTNMKNLITLDMGGTSTDISVIKGEPIITTEGSIEGYPLRIPMIDIHTIGAGGGSIAWLDEGGALRVGPQSAEADPGPACYNKGGTDPTVSDANLILGRLGSQLGGEMILDVTLAEQFMEPLCEKTGFNLVELASGITKVANANMCQGIRVVSVERGHDPRDLVLLAFGGAGPLHACELAHELSIPKVLIPVYPGVFSALGMVVADIKHEFVKTQKMAPDKDTKTVFDELEKKAVAILTQEGVTPDRMILQRFIDVRYTGQSYELRIPADNPVEKFHETHKRMYGYADKKSPVEFVNFRVVGIGKQDKIHIKRIEKATRNPEPTKMRNVFFDGFVKTPIYKRETLKYSHQIEGPAVIEEMESTILLPPDWVATVDEYGNLFAEVV
ncbi:MAG: hydantoinase/oxoprolinase family protein [Theionarchaea archaeon]|nr:hydantoinase/oxoprolinase family protein [Theionarchaea archaeon]